MEPSWVEDIDVDDSDLQSHTLLRRCKRQRCSDQHRSTTTITATYTSQSQTLDSAPLQSHHVDSVPRNLTSEGPAESLPQSRTIPGPAGIVQSAKLRKARDNICLFQGEQLMATQEYIRKVVEDPEEDEDFKRNPWLSAIKFLYAGETNSASCAPLGEINKYQKNGKLDQVVAVIKSCAPNEVGDMTVALKDPTGTVTGTIHQKVLTEQDIRKGICVGSVLILCNVSVFSPSQSTHYLNITKKNLLKVFYKDGGSSQKLTFNNETIDATPDSDSGVYTCTQPPSQDYGREASAFFVERGAEEITNRMKRSKSNEVENCETNTSDVEILKDAADVTEKDEPVVAVGQLNQGYTSHMMVGEWTDEQLLELDI